MERKETEKKAKQRRKERGGNQREPSELVGKWNNLAYVIVISVL
jgi:hypothetical protein